jgi:hypothetical protein
LQKNQIISQIIDSLSDSPTQLFQWLSGQDDEVLNLWAFGVLMQEGDYSAALTYLNALNSEDANWLDFVSVQQINISLLGSLETYEISDSEENFLLNIAEGNGSAAPYARTILQREFGVYITDEWPTNSSIELRSFPTEDEPKEVPWVSPNPFTSEIQLNLSHLDENETYDCMFYDLNGVKVLQMSNLQAAKHRIELSGLQSGIYFLELISNQGSLRTIKIIKQ